MILLVRAQVLGQLRNAGREQGDLHLGRTRYRWVRADTDQ